jgi:trk system potassium uptake protein
MNWLNEDVISKLKLISRVSYVIYFSLTFLFVLFSLYQHGFQTGYFFEERYEEVYTIFMLSIPIFLLIAFYYLFRRTSLFTGKLIYLFSSIWLILFGVFRIMNLTNSEIGKDHFFSDEVVFQIIVLIVFLIELFRNSTLVIKLNLSPAKVLLLSFLLLIFTGMLLLMLPNASHINMRLIDALFMSASAVCITGLAVLDTGQDLTYFGQVILLVLFQLGGIGIMTVTSFFAFFFKGGDSYQNQLYIKDFLHSDQLSNLFRILFQILMVTIGIETIGAILIYYMTDQSLWSAYDNRIFFSVFHSVSAFCNAGFSLLSDSLYDSKIRFNYSLQFIILSLFILGGLGFAVVFNLLKFIKTSLIRFFMLFIKRRPYKKSILILNLNSKIVLTTSGLLILFGTVFIYIFEYNYSLSEHSGFGKWIAALFASTTPRTAGFNNIGMDTLTFPTIMLIMLLMWIGASPGSTGGGIKTTTFAVAILNFITLAREKNRIEAFGRKISEISIRRTLAVIMLSLIVLGVSIFLLSIFDGDKELLPLAFESFSAFSTVGLSLGVTANLSDGGKLVLIFSMFIGRLGAITILIAMLRKVKMKRYAFPEEDIFIN